MRKLIGKITHAFDHLKKNIKKLNDQFWRAKCRYIKYYETLPIQDDVILLESQNAKKINGNMFYLIKYLASSEKYKDYKIYISSWGRYMKGMRATLNNYNIANVKVTLYSSDEYVRLLASAKYLFNDATFPFYYIKKEGQVYLNTWHGTPLKNMGRRVHNDALFGNVQKSMIVSDYLLYTNEFSKEVFIRDYMLENISSNSYVMGGYPRNEIFFDSEARQRVREELHLQDKRIYAYMPTWRGDMNNIGNAKNDAYLLHYLSEVDKSLSDDEVLYINLHPLALHAKNDVGLKTFKHIKKFPAKYETYDFLNIADVLITDYSSVFFDFVCTRKKIVLFPYDQEEYLEDRGMYLSLDELPFPKVYDASSLVNELRSEKNYDDTEFIERFNKYDNINASQQICDFAILGEDTGLKAEKIPNNGKENVLIYGGSLQRNGITTSLRSLLNVIDTDKRNYYITFYQEYVKKNASQLSSFNCNVNFFAVPNYFDLTVYEHLIRKAFIKKIFPVKAYMKKMQKRMNEEFLRAYGNVKFDAAIHFTGYGDETILQFSRFPKRNAIFVHNDMVNEGKAKGNQRLDILKYAYNNYDKVATVSEDIIPPTFKISKKDDNIITVHNIIDYKTILKRGEEKINQDETTECSVDEEYFDDVMKSSVPKFINIGRFAPEKGHDRLVNAFEQFLSEGREAYLIIMGGNAFDDGYNKLKSKINSMGLEKNIILLLNVSNPYPILKACDYFVLSSLYEGFGLVLAEADILGKPIVSTDIVGPKYFMEKYGGTLVESSEKGIYQALNMLYDGKIKTLNIDYEEYNRQCVNEFESIFL